MSENLSFNRSAKDDMLNTKGERHCCRKAHLYGCYLFSSKFERDIIKLVSESEKQIKQIIDLTKSELGTDISQFVSVMPSGKFKISCQKEEICSKILSSFLYDDNLTYTIKKENFVCENCVRAFLRGAFLACGNVSSPEKRYCLEFVVPYFNLSRELLYILKENGFSAMYTKRKSYYVIYFKESEKILDMLNFMGVHKAAFEYTDEKILREIRNACNRQNNCETANMKKTIETSKKQTLAINEIVRIKGWGFLSEQLSETAKIRLENPGATLEELTNLHNGSASKSCVRHRLKKLEEIYSEIKD